MVAETTIAFVFSTIGLVSTVVWLGLAVVGLTKLDEIRSALDDSDESGPEAETEPLEILRERYARGDLTDGEFERKAGRLLETGDESPGATEKALDLE